MQITYKQSPNFYDTPYELDTIVLHTTLGNIAGTISHLTNPTTDVSAHFVIDREGNITQLVSLLKAAWHAGYKYNMSQRAKDVIKKDLLGRYINPNLQTIGIELISGYDINNDGVVDALEKLYTSKQLNACADLILYCEKELHTIFDDKHILIHKDITSYKPDLETQRTLTLLTLDTKRKNILPDSSQPINTSSENNTLNENITFSDNEYGSIEVKNNKVVITKIKNHT